MPTTFHHQGLLTGDVARAGQFYVDALEGRWLVRPVDLDAGASERSAGQPGTRLRVGLVGFGDAALELFAFLGDVIPEWAVAAPQRRLPHLCLQVDDTDLALERVEAAGGRRLWDAVDRFGSARVVYVNDPEGNVIELFSRPASYLVSVFHRAFPESVPEAFAEQPAR